MTATADRTSCLDRTKVSAVGRPSCINVGHRVKNIGIGKPVGRLTARTTSGACLLVLLLASVASAFHGHRVYVANQGCGGVAYRPSAITIACGTGQFYVTRLIYSSYNGAQANAHGTLRLDDCQPDCASGKFKSYPGRVTLKDIVRCHGRLYYSRISWRFIGSSPTSASTGTQNIGPFLPCTRLRS